MSHITHDKHFSSVLYLTQQQATQMGKKKKIYIYILYFLEFIKIKNFPVWSEGKWKYSENKKNE